MLTKEEIEEALVERHSEKFKVNWMRQKWRLQDSGLGSNVAFSYQNRYRTSASD